MNEIIIFESLKLDPVTPLVAVQSPLAPLRYASHSVQAIRPDTALGLLNQQETERLPPLLPLRQSQT